MMDDMSEKEMPVTLPGTTETGGPRLEAVAGGARPSTPVRSARFAEFDQGEPSRGTETMDFLMDVGLSVGVELGRTEMLVKDVLKLSPGSVIELRRMATDPVEVFVNNRVVARGEVVVVDDKFGVRITEIVS